MHLSVYWILIMCKDHCYSEKCLGVCLYVLLNWSLRAIRRHLALTEEQSRVNQSSETKAVTTELLHRAVSWPCILIIREGKDLLVPAFRLLKCLFFCRLKPYDLTRVLSFLVNQGCWIWELIFFHCTFHQTNNSQHAMVTVEQTPAVRPIERLPLIPRKAGSSPGWVIARPAPVSALLVLPL